MSTSAPPVQIEFHADLRINRWRPLVQWLLAIPLLMIAWALRSLRGVLTLISLFTVLFTEEIPRPLFDVIVMTYRCEWRAMSYVLFMHEDYPPFDFTRSCEDDGQEPHTSLRLAYPEQLERWKPLYKWFLAIPQYFVLAGLFVAACLGIVAGPFVVLLTGEYPEAIRDFLVSARSGSSGWLHGEASRSVGGWWGGLKVCFDPFVPIGQEAMQVRAGDGPFRDPVKASAPRWSVVRQ